jgi:hypothetical protein
VAAAEVPAGVVTVTLTAPVASAAGLVTVILVALSEEMVAAALPKWTAVAPARLVPLMVTVVPPVSGPLLGLTPLTAGGGAT